MLGIAVGHFLRIFVFVRWLGKLPRAVFSVQRLGPRAITGVDLGSNPLFKGL
jgi:hypothetical protein